MDLIQHFQDNLNENFTNLLHVKNFIKIAEEARAALNKKYHDGEFSDPADYDPNEAHPVTWSTVDMGVEEPRTVEWDPKLLKAETKQPTQVKEE